MYFSQKKKPLIYNYVPWHNQVDTKKFLEVYNKLNTFKDWEKWEGIRDSLILIHDPNSETTSIELTIIDKFTNTHYFIIELEPETPFDANDEKYIHLRYDFEFKHFENKAPVRSFLEYIMPYLVVNGFEPILISDGNGMRMPCHIDCLYEAFCKLMELVLSKIKSKYWFYLHEPNISCFDDMHIYFLQVLKEIRSQAFNGRWLGIVPDCFGIESYDEECAISIRYEVDGVWEWLITINGLWHTTFTDLSISLLYFPCYELSQCFQKELDTLFKKFFENIPIAKGNIYVGGEKGEHSLSIQYFHIEDSLELFCNLLDEITVQLKSFNFWLPLKSIISNEEMDAMKKQPEESLLTSLSIVTQEDEVNMKFKNGYFKK